MHNVARFRNWVQDMTHLVERHGADEPRMLDEGEKLLHALVTADDWLPGEFAIPSNESYRQYLLYCDPRERFSAVSFVWQPGQKTPVHDHTVWGLVRQGDVDRVSPRIGAVRRHTFDAATGTPKEFISGYQNNLLPNLWDRSKEPRS
ncbi:MAG: cysteine dioxygenase [Betaproteobacteria bacterium]|nr:cysteine dioxygenase [Betaproteobacteria bacterium]